VSTYFKNTPSSLLNNQLLILCGLFIVIGLIGIIADLEEGKYLLIIGSIGLLLKKGVIIDIDKRLMKSYWGLLGIRFGKWKSLPKVFILIITKISKLNEYNLPSGGAQYFSETTEFRLGIGINGKIQSIISTGNYNLLIEEGKELSESLSVELLDAIKKSKS